MNQALKQFNEDLREAHKVADEAMIEFMDIRKEQRIHERLVRMQTYKFIKTIKDLGHVPSLAVSQVGDTTKDGGAWLPNSNTEERI